MNKITTKPNQLTILSPRFVSLGLNPHKLTQFISLATIDLRDKILPKFGKNDREQVIKEYGELACILARFNILPDPINQKAYILPFSKTTGKKLSLQIGYKAYIQFAEKSGFSLNTQIIYSNDEYNIDLASSIISHKPEITNRGEPIAVYTVAKKSGESIIEFMTKDDMKEVKAMVGFTGKGSPWGSFEGEMWKKTCLKRCIKRLDLSGTDIELVNMVDDKLGYGEDNIKVVDEVLDTIQQPELKNQTQKLQEEEGDF